MENEAKIKRKIKGFSEEQRRRFTAGLITQIAQTVDLERREDAIQTLSFITFDPTKEVTLFLRKAYQGAVDKQSKQTDPSQKAEGLAALERVREILEPYLLYKKAEQPKGEEYRNVPSIKTSPETTVFSPPKDLPSQDAVTAKHPTPEPASSKEQTKPKKKTPSRAVSSDRRENLLSLAKQGFMPKEIAQRLNISHATIRKDFERLRKQGLLEAIEGRSEKGTSKAYHPILTRKQEQMLFQKLNNGEEISSLTQDSTFFTTISEKDKTKWANVLGTNDTVTGVIAACNHRLVSTQVIKMKRTVLGKEIEFQDLIQAGKIGLLKAIEKFNPLKGNKLSSYAIPWIIVHINLEIERQLGVTPDTHQAINKALRLSYGFKKIYEQKPTAEMLADLLLYNTNHDIRIVALDNAVTFMQTPPMRSLYEKVTETSEMELLEMVPDTATILVEREQIEHDEEMAALYTAIDTRLTPEEKDLAQTFFNLDDTDSPALATLGEHERALLEQALGKLRESPELEKQKKERVGAKPDALRSTQTIQIEDSRQEREPLENQIEIIRELGKSIGQSMSAHELRDVRRSVAKNEQTEAIAQWLKEGVRLDYLGRVRSPKEAPAEKKSEVHPSQKIQDILPLVSLLKAHKWKITPEISTEIEKRKDKFLSQILLLKTKGWNILQIALLLKQPETIAKKAINDYKERIDTRGRAGGNIINLVHHALETGLIHPDAVLYGIPLEKLDLLKPVEKRVFDRLGSGSTRKEISDHLSISPRTLNYHIEKIYKKLGREGTYRLEVISHALQIKKETTGPISPEQMEVLHLFEKDLKTFGNHEEKALLLASLQEDKAYSIYELRQHWISLQDKEDIAPIDSKILLSWCRDIFVPAGILQKNKEGKYKLSPYGASFGKAFAGHLLEYSQQHPDLSLISLLGNNPSNRVRVITELLKNLQPKYVDILNVLKENSLTERRNQALWENHLKPLVNLGIIAYDSEKETPAFRYADNPPVEPPPLYEQRRLTRHVQEVFIDNPTVDLTHKDLAPFLRETNPLYSSPSKNISPRHLIGITNFLEKLGYLERKNIFDSQTKSKITLLKKKELEDFYKIINGFLMNDSDFIGRGKEKAAEIVNNPQKIALLVKKARETSVIRNRLDKEVVTDYVIQIMQTLNEGVTTAELAEMLSQQFKKFVRVEYVLNILKPLREQGVLRETRKGNLLRFFPNPPETPTKIPTSGIVFESI